MFIYLKKTSDEIIYNCFNRAIISLCNTLFRMLSSLF